MKSLPLFALLCALALFSCKKENGPTDDKKAPTIDSLFGRWQIERMSVVEYDQTTSGIDTLSTTINNGAYFEFKTDSSFVIYEGNQEGFSGVLLGISNGEILMKFLKQTFDNFGPDTHLMSPPVLLNMRINILTPQIVVLSYSYVYGTPPPPKTKRFHYFLKR